MSEGNNTNLVLTFFLTICYALVQTAFAKDKTQVQIEAGVKIEGAQMTTLNNNHFLAFKGIPYAEPPTGDLRFKPPVAKKWITDFFDGSKKESPCIQNIFGLTIGQEDCLTLNVYTQKTSWPLKPVLVFIHAAMFMYTTSGIHGPRRLLDHNIVVVTVNYRLGALGFLGTIDDASPGNYALQDQTEALKWVQRNIAAFGGDPNQVTLQGEGSGSACISQLMLTPETKGLFHRVILQSGNLLCPWAQQPNPLQVTQLLADKIECKDSDTTKMVSCLRKSPVKKLLQAQTDIQKDKSNFLMFSTVKDVNFLADLPSTLFKKGLQSTNISVMMGINQDEALIFLPLLYLYEKGNNSERLKNDVSMTLKIDPKDLSDVIEIILRKYFTPASLKNGRRFHEVIEKMGTDAAFFVPHFVAVKTFISHGINPYVYSFDYYNQRSSIAKHFGFKKLKKTTNGDDLNFLFDIALYFPFTFRHPNNEIESKFLDMWVNFIKNGNPTAGMESDTVEWKPAVPGQINVYHLDSSITSEVYNPDEDWRLKFWTEDVKNAVAKLGLDIF